MPINGMFSARRVAGNNLGKATCRAVLVEIRSQYLLLQDSENFDLHFDSLFVADNVMSDDVTVVQQGKEFRDASSPQHS